MTIYSLTFTQVSDVGEDFELARDDPSLNDTKAFSLKHEFNINKELINRLFLDKYNLGYISEYCVQEKEPLKVITYPAETTTCYEKSEALNNCSPLNVIKALYFEPPSDESLYGVIVPETGCFIDRDILSRELFGSSSETLIKARHLPDNMTFGTCSPFVQGRHLRVNGGRVKSIIFDEATLKAKAEECSLDDFSFGVERNYSIQINYHACFKLLKAMFQDAISVGQVLNMRFREQFERKKGRIKIHYDFHSLDYSVAKFINDYHGVGDVMILNDHTDEMFIPELIDNFRAKRIR